MSHGVHDPLVDRVVARLDEDRLAVVLDLRATDRYGSERMQSVGGCAAVVTGVHTCRLASIKSVWLGRKVNSGSEYLGET